MNDCLRSLDNSRFQQARVSGLVLPVSSPPATSTGRRCTSIFWQNHIARSFFCRDGENLLLVECTSCSTNFGQILRSRKSSLPPGHKYRTKGEAYIYVPAKSVLGFRYGSGFHSLDVVGDSSQVFLSHQKLMMIQ